MRMIDTSRDQSGPHTAGPPQSRSHHVRRTLSYASVRPSGPPAQRAALTLGLAVGSALLATSGAIHLHLWAMGYRTIPSIGPLFLFQGIAGIAMALLLVVSRRLLLVVMAAGFMIATIGGLLLSIYFGLFGFRDTLAAPFAGVSVGVESAGTVILALVGIVLVLGHTHSAARMTPSTDLGDSKPLQICVDKSAPPLWHPSGDLTKQLNGKSWVEVRDEADQPPNADTPRPVEVDGNSRLELEGLTRDTSEAITHRL